jgi:hypothetical protein
MPELRAGHVGYVITGSRDVKSAIVGDTLYKPSDEVRLLPIRPRSRCERRSLRTFPVVTLHPRFPFNV